jgi:hypothetical protein
MSHVTSTCASQEVGSSKQDITWAEGQIDTAVQFVLKQDCTNRNS